MERQPIEGFQSGRYRRLPTPHLPVLPDRDSGRNSRGTLGLFRPMYRSCGRGWRSTLSKAALSRQSRAVAARFQDGKGCSRRGILRKRSWSPATGLGPITRSKEVVPVIRAARLPPADGICGSGLLCRSATLLRQVICITFCATALGPTTVRSKPPGNSGSISYQNNIGGTRIEKCSATRALSCCRPPGRPGENRHAFWFSPQRQVWGNMFLARWGYGQHSG